MKTRSTSFFTFLGLMAICFWSTTVAFSRDIIETMGLLNSAFFILLGSGIFLFFIQFLRFKKGIFPLIKKLPFSYYYQVGSFLILYMVIFYIALGEANSTEAVLVVGLLNYLWPSFAFILSIFILKNRSRVSVLILGIITTFVGTFMALTSGNQLGMGNLGGLIQKNMIPYILAFLAAVIWGAYSNLTRKYQIKSDAIAIPVLFIISSIVILILALIKGIIPQFNLPSSYYLKFAYIVIFPTSLSYLFWDRAMKKGNKKLVLSVAYLIPLLSTLITVFYFKAKLSMSIGMAAILIILGAVFCHRSQKDDI